MNAKIKVFNSAVEISIRDFDDEIWQKIEPAILKYYWSGELAPIERQAAARLLWTNEALFARFDCAQHEPLIISENPDLKVEAPGLWERDVCEIFVAPDKSALESYFEFEVAPTGEWLDYQIRQLSDRRETDTSYNSGIETAARIDEKNFALIFKIEWSAFGKKPTQGEEWAGNLFRCVGTGDSRGYSTWRPTKTEKPNFHVPAAFGIFEF